MIPYEQLNNLHIVKGLDPIANAFAGTVTTPPVDLSNHQSALFLVHKAVGATGTATITIEACDAPSPTTITAVPFYSKAITTTDQQGAITVRTAAGFVTTAGSSQVYAIMVHAEELANVNLRYVRLKSVESVASPVLGGVLIALAGPRFGGSAGTTQSEID